MYSFHRLFIGFYGVCSALLLAALIVNTAVAERGTRHRRNVDRLELLVVELQLNENETRRVAAVLARSALACEGENVVDRRACEAEARAQEIAKIKELLSVEQKQKFKKLIEQGPQVDSRREPSRIAGAETDRKLEREMRRAERLRRREERRRERELRRGH